MLVNRFATEETAQQLIGADGMTLRDWFAGMAITMVGEQCGGEKLLDCETPAQKYARQCYKMADAMLAARVTTAAE